MQRSPPSPNLLPVFSKTHCVGYRDGAEKAPALWHLTKVRMNQNRSGFSSETIIKLRLNFTHFFYEK